MASHPASPPRRRAFALAAIILVFTLGCLCSPTSLFSNPTATWVPPVVPPTPAVPPTEPPTEVVLPPTAVPATTVPTGALDPTGPWLLIEASQGLYAANPDGTGLTQLTDTDYWRGNVRYAVQPDANEVAYLTPGDFSFNHLALNLLSLPDGKTIATIDLTSAATEAYATSGPGDPGFEALRAIGERQSFTWSPDGSKLAFVGAMDGPSADLYLYDESADQVTRVSSDPDQDFSPSWSPDGQHLLYLEAKGFGTGAGMSMSAVWVADGDGSNPVKLYDTSSSGEEVLGWLDDTTVLLDTWGVVCGPGNLRLLDVTTRAVTVLAKDCITSATASGWRNMAMYSDDTGTYLLTAENRTPVKVSEEKNAMIQPWGPDSQVFVVRFQNASLATFGENDYEHAVSPITAEPDLSMLPFDQTDMSFYALIWGWTSRIPELPGAWITAPGSDADIGKIFDAPARFPTWSAHNNFIFFAPLEGGYDMYLTTFDSHYTDLHVVNHLDADILGTVWIGPPVW